MISLLLETDPASWVTPSALAGGGAAGLIAFAIIFIRFMRETQVSFFTALSETRKSCDEAMIRLAEKFSEDARAVSEDIRHISAESSSSSARLEKSMESLTNEVRSMRNKP